MKKENIKIIQEIIADKLALESSDINLGRTLDSLGCDSLDFVDIMVAIEDRFDIDMDKDDIYAIWTVSDLVKTVERYIEHENNT